MTQAWRVALVVASVSMGGCASKAEAVIVAPEIVTIAPPAPPPVAPAASAPVAVAPETEGVPADPVDDPLPASALGPGTHARSALRDPRVARVRAVALVVTELQGLENLFAATPANALDRAPLARRLAEDYVELARLGSPGAAANASHKAIQYYSLVRTDYPSYPQGDEVDYFLGYEYEVTGDLANARRAYYEVIQKYPSSRFVPYAYFGFGDMFLAEADSDPSKLEFALQAFAQVAKFSRSDLASEAQHRVTQIRVRQGGQGDKSNATTLHPHVYPGRPGGTGSSSPH